MVSSHLLAIPVLLAASNPLSCGQDISIKNTFPITGYWDCCKPACSAHDSVVYDSFETCNVKGLDPRVRHSDQSKGIGESVCKMDLDTLKSQCGTSQGCAECSARTPRLESDVLYSYVSYTEVMDVKRKHQQCGQCRELKLNSTGARVTTAKVKLINSKPYPEPGHGLVGYRFLTPGAGMGDYINGCICAFPAIYTKEICGEDGNHDTEHCHRFGGMQDAVGCAAFENPDAVRACNEINLGILKHGSYWRDGSGGSKGFITILDDKVVDCDLFDSVMEKNSTYIFA